MYCKVNYPIMVSQPTFLDDICDLEFIVDFFEKKGIDYCFYRLTKGVSAGLYMICRCEDDKDIIRFKEIELMEKRKNKRVDYLINSFNYLRSCEPELIDNNFIFEHIIKSKNRRNNAKQ